MATVYNIHPCNSVEFKQNHVTPDNYVFLRTFKTDMKDKIILY